MALVADISVNRKKIVDSIAIKRISGKPGEVCTYKIDYPEGPWCDVEMKHEYDAGYFPLLLEALTTMSVFGYQPKREEDENIIFGIDGEMVRKVMETMKTGRE